MIEESLAKQLKEAEDYRRWMDKRLDKEVAELARSVAEIEAKTVKTLMEVDKRVK